MFVRLHKFGNILQKKVKTVCQNSVFTASTGFTVTWRIKNGTSDHWTHSWNLHLGLLGRIAPSQAHARHTDSVADFHFCVQESPA